MDAARRTALISAVCAFAACGGPRRDVTPVPVTVTRAPAPEDVPACAGEAPRPTEKVRPRMVVQATPPAGGGVLFSPDGLMIAPSGKRLLTWNMRDGILVRVDRTPARLDLIAAAWDDARGRAIFHEGENTPLSNEGWAFDPHTGAVERVSLAGRLLVEGPSGPLLIRGTWDDARGALWYRDASGVDHQLGAPSRQPAPSALGGISELGPRELAMSAARDVVAIVDDRVLVSRGFSGAIAPLPIPPGETTKVAVSPRGDLIAASLADAKRTAVYLARGNDVRTLVDRPLVRDEAYTVAALRFSPDGRSLYALQGERLVAWDAGTGAVQWTRDVAGARATQRPAQPSEPRLVRVTRNEARVNRPGGGVIELAEITFTGGESIHAMQGASTLVFVDRNKAPPLVRMHDRATGAFRGELRGALRAPGPMHFDGADLIVWYDDARVRWTQASGQARREASFPAGGFKEGNAAVTRQRAAGLRAKLERMGRTDLVPFVDRGVAVCAASGWMTECDLEIVDGTTTIATTKGEKVLDAGGSRSAERSEDGTVLLRGVSDGRLLATLAAFDDDEFLAFTPAGAYTGTPEAAARVAWVYDAPLDAFRFEQFSSAYRREDIVKRRLAGEDVDAPGIDRRPPRVVSIEAPARAADKARVRVRVASPTRVDAVRVFVDGRPAAAKALCAREGLVEFDLTLSTGRNRVTVVASDDAGLVSNPRHVDIESSGAAAREADVWVVALGVSAYPKLGPEYQLAYADDDATAVARAVAAQAGEGKRYRRAHTQVLLDREVTRDRALAAFDTLAAMGPNDVAVVFLAGHGVKPSDAADMIFMTHETGASRESVVATGIGWTQLAERLARARGRVLVLLDACHSGHLSQELVVPNNQMAGALVKQGRAGVVVFAAAKGSQVSYEPQGTRGLALDTSSKQRSPAIADHGLFTASVLLAMEDREADRDADGALQLSELVDDVTLRVGQLSGWKQTPWIARREMFGDFALAAAKK